MVRLLLRQALRFVSGVIGAFLLAAALAALSVPGAADGTVPYWLAFAQRLTHMAQFDFGLSEVSGWSAFGMVAGAMPYTANLVFLGAIVAFLIGVPLGLLLGTGPVRRAAAPLIQIVAAAPVFCGALALSWISTQMFALRPLPPSDGIFAGDAAHAMAVVLLPVLTVGLAGAAAVQLALRRAASETQGEPWRAGLRMMGLPAFEIERLYVVPRVFAEVLNHLGDVTLALFSAAAVAEWVFGWPGAAVLFVKSLAFGDWNVVALVLLVFAIVKFAADFVGALACDALIGGEVGR
jgi:peptide/nickel transport system permease protein